MTLRIDHRRGVGICLVLLIAPLCLALATALPTSAQTPTTPLPNPEMDDSCGISATLILDASGSISSAGAVEDVRDAGTAFLEALADTNSTARVIDFGTVARETAPTTQVTADSVAPGGVHADAMEDYYHPKPPFQPGVQGHRYGGGNVSSPSSYSSGSDTQYTNWDQALDRSGRETSELIVFLTDGDTTAVDSDQPGDPFYTGDANPDVRYQMDHSSSGTELALDRAVQEANEAKADGTRVLAIGVGDAFGSSAAVDNLVDVSGPQIVTEGDEVDDINSVDVALVEDFDVLTDALRRVVIQLCSPSLTIRKLAQSPGSAAYAPTAGWTMTVEPSVSGGGIPPYEWKLPVADAPVGPQSAVTDSNGFANFQWKPNPPTASSTATVTETVQPGWAANDYSCQVRQPDGRVDESSGTLDPSDPAFDLDLGPESIATCTLRNDFDYAPGIAITKENAPTLVRGDGGGSVVTSTYTVTNTGNAPLSVTTPTDDECNPVTYVSGDTDDDNLLDLTETWTYTCDRLIRAGITDQPLTVDNTVDVIGTDPDGNQVDGDATDDVDVITPDIVIDKSVDQPTVTPGTAVTYTYDVTTNGNTPLSPVAVTDDTCTSPAYQSGDDGDNALEPGETWTYTCGATINETTINTATATGTPPLGPDVTDDDTEIVEVIHPDLQLQKSVSSNLVLPGTEVTYTFVVTNAGDSVLVPVPPTTRADFVADDQCSPIYESGDTDDDSRMTPDEQWTYTCTATIDDTVLNTATVTAQAEGTSDQLTRVDREIVIPLTPEIDIEKSASASVVDDGDDVTYTYEVTNPGLVDLQDVVVTDDLCAPVTYQSGDDGDELIQPGELWTYTCTATLTKSGASPNAPETITNTADVSGTPLLNDQTGEPVTDEATADVDVIDPQITVTKVADADEVRVGEDVTYTVTVTNTGDSPIVFVAELDTDCNPLTYVSGDDGDDGIADVGEAWVYTCTQEALVDVANTAGVGGLGVLGEILVDTDPAEVTVYDPDVDLTKTVDDALVPEGSTVTYIFEVTNPGDDPLSDVTIVDTACSPLTFVSGDTNGDTVLDLDETWTYTCEAAIDEPVVNVALVRGLDHLEEPVFAGDAAAVQPYVAGIDVAKTATPEFLVDGGEVTYSYAVTNTGNVPLADVAGRITDDTCEPVTYVSGDLDDNGLLTGEGDLFETGPPETWLFECTTTVTETTQNTVVVDGTPVRPTPDGPDPIGPDVDNDDAANVVVVPAATVRITKTTSPVTEGTFRFAGSFGAFAITTGADGTGVIEVDGLPPGRYTVSEMASDDWVISVTCDDPTGDSAGGGSGDIVLAPGETVDCTFTNTAATDDTGTGGGTDGDLATTGTAILLLLATGLSLVGLGAGLLLVRRRHPRLV